jgi:hypothetical protein
MRKLVPLLACLAWVVAGPAAAQRPTEGLVRGIAEDVLVRAALERGAFAACAALGPEPAEAVTHLRTFWVRDVADAATLLRGAGLSDAAVGALANRFDLDKVTPRFAEPQALQAFCSVVGDWQTRYEQFRYIVPQHEMKRLLERR